MTRRDAAQVLAMVAWTEQKLRSVKKHAVDELDVRFPGEGLHGSVEVDGTAVVVSKSTRVQNAPKLSLVDPVRFAEWVQKRWPTEIVPAVSPAFLEQLQGRMERTGGVLVDDDGEVCEWAELTQSDPYTRTSLTKAADAALAPLLAERSITDLVRFIENEPVDLDGAQ